MAHYVASINVFQYPTKTRVSMKVFCVYEYGAKPSRPVWKTIAELPAGSEGHPREWIVRLLERLPEEI